MRANSTPPPRTKGVLDELFDAVKTGDFHSLHERETRNSHSNSNSLGLQRHATFGMSLGASSETLLTSSGEVEAGSSSKK